jgi:hypothetical protein
MRISELFEQYDEPSHMLARLAGRDSEESIAVVDKAITDIQAEYKKDKNNPNIYIDKLEELQEVLLRSLEDETLWNILADSLSPSDLQSFYQDFVNR